MKLIDAMRILREAPTEAEPFRASLACGFAPAHLLTFLAAHLQSLLPDHRVEIKTGLYGDIAGNLKLIAETEGDSAAIVLEWPDLDPRLSIRRLGGWGPKELGDILKGVRLQVDRIQELLLQASTHVPSAISFPALPLPPASYTPSWQASGFDLELHEHVSRLATWAEQQVNLRVANGACSFRSSSLADRFDVQSEILSGFPYAIPFASRLAEVLARLMRNPVPKKGLITDLDDTLWSGILGEVGLEGISWDLDHKSHMHGLYQQVLQALSQEGVLIGVASRNDPSLVEQVLRSGRIFLSAKDVFPAEAHWGPKSESVTRILQAWNVGADSVVFIDDSPMDLAEVKSIHPEVECILFPREDYKAIYELLERLRDLFGKSAMSEEDSIRLESLRRAEPLRERSGNKTSPDDFLAQAEAELKLSFRKSPPDPRALELVNKTNQFNLNGRRYTEAAWQAYLSKPETFLLTATYLDKYGPLGKIVVIAGNRTTKTLFIDVWVMSCRAFSRRIEYSCLAQLFKKFGAEEVALDFEATERNAPFQDFVSYFSPLTSDSDLRISQRSFAEKCPALFDAVEELKNE